MSEEREYLTNENGEQYYMDENGQKAYVMENGTVYYYDENGYPFSYDENGKEYYYDENWEPYYPEGADFEPNLIAFCCNWCSYTGADQAGASKVQYPDNVSIIRTMCSGMVHPNFVIDALNKGADGVLICGCHPGDCHYIEGNIKAEARADSIYMMLEDMGIEAERFKLEWVSASEGKKFAQTVTEMVKTLKNLGPSPYKR